MAATPQAVSHVLPLQPFPPYPLPTPSPSRTGARHRRGESFIACSKGLRGSHDDYHATLRALNSKGRTPRKSLGQHYMLNNDINEQLVNAAGVKEGDVVLEIGPGTGSLTNVLIHAGATVLGIEKDPYMASIVTERFAETNRLKVLREDFVKCHIHSHMSSFLASIVSDMKPRYAKEETAVRLVVSALRTSEYRPINIFVNFYSVPEYKFNVPRTNFFPQPNVDAAVVKFRLKKTADYPPVSSTRSFFSMVNSAFNGKRKMLRKSLQHLCTAVEIEKALEEVGLPATSRPGELTLDDFVKLHNLMVKD
ncbi:ribosomal RNA small subunit methyltransferase, chloroplastic isoform X2 [Eucalyptus grandis]|uniref:ribosomal RNA small subunit methyltransferase, chloroplastic isoform X2 n=1 Tax=Eucalyptus grandis TaxID=71139 RepID=UPI00192EF0AE|nr:ribosomal RNA small subunit methyltransferase, chloroplastic isoform X2 [Eucalyptus grandis]